jgi:hypothetical protein
MSRSWEDSGPSFVSDDHRVTGEERLVEPQPVAPLPRRAVDPLSSEEHRRIIRNRDWHGALPK